MGNALLLPQSVAQSAPSVPSISALAAPVLATLWGDQVPFNEGVGMSGHPLLPQSELYSRICVRDPYFALREVTMVGPGEVLARVPVEQDPGAEASPINAAEVGRHLAILGSCASALVNPKEGQHYYLARRARLERLHDGPRARLDEPLWGLARAEFVDKRCTRASTVLADPDGLPLYSLEVDYHVLSAAAFLRLFQGARVELRREPRAERAPRGATPADFAAMRSNPHREPPPLKDYVHDGECMKATLAVTAELCKGHFALHPVLPVAVVMSGLSGLAGSVLRHLVGNEQARYLVTRGEVRADSLAYAGETVTFGAHRQSVQGSEHRFYCWASVGERLIGVMDLTLTSLE